MEKKTDTGAEWYREMGKLLYAKCGDDAEMRTRGIGYLLKAHRLNDAEASHIVARLILERVLEPVRGDPEEKAMNILYRLARRGYIPSRVLLNRVCAKRYEEHMAGTKKSSETPYLTDFDGKRIKISRKGCLTPIDAELEYKDGKNVLTFSANISFLYEDELENPEKFRMAVLDGISQWEGEYTVFGGQSLTVKMNLTTEERLFDNVMVFPVAETIESLLHRAEEVIPIRKSKEQISSLIKGKRSFAVAGLRWSVRSRKLIYIWATKEELEDYNEIKNVAKHEFGHALGLGDLYKSREDGLSGVEKGTFGELDGYYVGEKTYNLVMCDHYGPISNNDIEMAVLAFSKNKMQLYQKKKNKGKVSQALGRGN